MLFTAISPSGRILSARNLTALTVQGITEQLKAQDQMAWARRMNNIRNAAEEIVNAEVIFA